MARLSLLDDYRSELRRATVTLAVVAAHLAVIVVMLRSTGHSADVVEITLFALPISPEDRRREPIPAQKPPIAPAARNAPRRAAAARESTSKQHVASSLEEPSKSETDALDDRITPPTEAASEPVPPIDWHAEIARSARALEQHDRAERGRRSLAGPNQPALPAPLEKPACPYERCEPGWGENLGIFKPSLHSKAGRIETIPDDIAMTPNGSLNVTGRDVIIWINNHCYAVIASQDPSRRGMNKCTLTLGKSAARGDLFDHMHEGQPPKSHDTKAPWISYSLSIGASHTDPRADR